MEYILYCPDRIALIARIGMIAMLAMIALIVLIAMSAAERHTALSDGLGQVAKYMQKKLTRKVLERPHICFILEKLQYIRKSAMISLVENISYPHC